MKPHSIGRALLLVATIALAPLASHAQSPKDKQALQLYEHGKKLIEDGKDKQACAALKQSLEIEEAINTQYQFGRCNEAQDRYLEAHRAYLRASTMARTANDQKRASIAQQRADDLKPKIPKLVIVVDPQSRVAGLTIRRGDETIAESDWGKAIPIDPGDHTVTASASGHQEWSQGFRASRTGGTTKISVPALQPGGGSMPPPPPPPPPDGDGDEEYTGPTERRSTGMFIAGVILIPIGGLSLLAAPIVYGVNVADTGNTEAEPLPIALAALGVVCLGVGIPLLVVGNADVPVEQPAAEPPPPEAALLVGPTSANLRVTF